jgi:acid phosphatase (class A)
MNEGAKMNLAKTTVTIILGLISVTGLGGCATTSKVGAAASVARTLVTPAGATGYDWALVLPPAPLGGSAVDRVDMESVRGFQSLQGSARWTQATNDNSLDMVEVYGPIIGPDFTASKRPEMVALLAYAGRQFSVASRESKSTFPRPRPFLADPTLKICVNEPPAGSSYPSGHSGWGWLSALIVARVEPTHASAILARGREYGQSRVVCGVHYPTDVDVGRLLGDAMLARLDNDSEYQRLLAAAKGGVR